MAKAMKEIARDVEYAIVRNTTATEGDAVNPGQFGGIPHFNSVNTVDAQGAALTETMLNDAIQKQWTAGGNAELCIVPGRTKRLISSFTAGATKNFDQGEKKLINVVDVKLIGIAC